MILCAEDGLREEFPRVIFATVDYKRRYNRPRNGERPNGQASEKPVDTLATQGVGFSDAHVGADGLVGLPLIRQWIGFDTTSRESNLALIEWSRTYLESFGASTTL